MSHEFTVTINALFDIDDHRPNPEWNPSLLLSDADVVVAIDINSQSEIVLVGHGIERQYDTQVVFVEMDFDQGDELARLILVLKSLGKMVAR